MRVEQSSLFGDLNNDCIVDISDLVIVAGAFGSTPGLNRWNPVADIDHDGTVDLGDLVAVIAQLGQRC